MITTEALRFLISKGFNKFVWRIKADTVLHTAIHTDETINPILDHIDKYWYGNDFASHSPLTEMIPLDSVK